MKMKSKMLIAVEYISEKGLDFKTFEVFEKIKDAYEFGMKLEDWQKKEFFIADFDMDLIYREKNGKLNYVDDIYLYGYYIPIKKLK